MVTSRLRYTFLDMSDASEELAGDLERTLEHLARAIGEVSPGNDVFEPMGLVRRWLDGLELVDRGRFLRLLGSDEWEVQLAAIARSVLSGATVWSAAPACDPAPAPLP